MAPSYSAWTESVIALSPSPGSPPRRTSSATLLRQSDPHRLDARLHRARRTRPVGQELGPHRLEPDGSISSS